MQIQRLLGDREVLVGDGVFGAQGRSNSFVEHSGGELVVKSDDERPTRFKPADLGCYVVHLSRTERGLAKEQLQSFWEGQKHRLIVAAILFVGTFDGTYLIFNN